MDHASKRLFYFQ